MSIATLPPPAAFDSTFAPDEALYEIVDGQVMEIPSMSAYAGRLASRLSFQMMLAAEAGRLGEVVVETLFRIPLNEDRSRNRRPDVAFVSSDRWPTGKPLPPSDAAWDVVPDLAVEVVSPTDLFEDVIGKVAEYFRAGVRLVWVVLPIPRQVYVYESPTLVRIVTDAEALDGRPVLPGFLLPLANLFDSPLPPPTPAE